MPTAMMEAMEAVEVPTTEAVTSETPEPVATEAMTPEAAEAMASESVTAEANFLNAVGLTGHLQFKVGDLCLGRCGKGQRRQCDCSDGSYSRASGQSEVVKHCVSSPGSCCAARSGRYMV